MGQDEHIYFNRYKVNLSPVDFNIELVLGEERLCVIHTTFENAKDIAISLLSLVNRLEKYTVRQVMGINDLYKAIEDMKKDDAKKIENRHVPVA